MHMIAHSSERDETISASAAGRRIDRSGAICCRVERGGALTVLLIASRETGRWTIPTGIPGRREKPYRCAQRQALQEVGVSGKVRKKPLAHYADLSDPGNPLRVSLHLLRLKSEAGHCAEYAQRQKIWISPAQAALLVEEPELRALFLSFDADNPLTSQDRLKPRRIHGRHPAHDAPVSLASSAASP
ncbi:NUDIX hydrolase [Rhizobium sp. GCM10022189]|uniref:NUDIX hydrolase n=1 Tax=Rhizobium sp. GCM10022189 TaxID=3252654 RepID=UPI000DD6566F